MEVINSSGRRVSLLNDDADSSYPYDYSVHSSPATSPGAFSVETPSLSRSDTSDSHSSASPSPLTPSMSSDSISAATSASAMAAGNMRPQIASQSSYSYPSPQPYPLLSAAQAMHSPPKQLVYLQTGLPPMDSHHSHYPTTPKASTKKNHYPCPVAKQYGCHDFFTTSGHAARHAKKHTGKKDAVCPECSKAFTRKDNMEQHRRTHSGGRALSANTSTTKAQIDASRERKAMRLQQQQQLQRRRSRATNGSTSDFALDPQLQTATPSPYTPVSDYEFPQQLAKTETQQRPELRRSSHDGSITYARSVALASTQYSNLASPSPSLAPALDALALAASRQ